MAEFLTSELEQKIRAAVPAPRSGGRLRERVIGAAVSARVRRDPEMRFGHMLAAVALTCLLAATVCKHASLMGVAPAMIGVQPSVVHWTDPEGPDVEAATPGSETREWKQVKRTSRRKHELAQLLVRCFGN